MRRALAIVGLCVLAAVAGPAGAEGTADPIVPVVTVTPAAPNIGDQVMVRVSVTVPANLLVSFPRLERRIGGFALTGRLAPAPEAAATGSRDWVQLYRLEPEETGLLSFPPIEITIQDPATLAAIAVTAPATEIRVASVVPEDADLRDARAPRGPATLPEQDAPLGSWLFAAAGLAAVVGAFLLWRRRRPAAAPAAAAVSPREAALSALHALAPGDGSDDASGRFHVGLADALRRFLEDGLAIAAPRRTTDELRDHAAASAVPGLAVLVAGPLAACDQVKFARHRPTQDAMSRVLAEAIGFVEQTEEPARDGAPGTG